MTHLTYTATPQQAASIQREALEQISLLLDPQPPEGLEFLTIDYGAAFFVDPKDPLGPTGSKVELHYAPGDRIAVLEECAGWVGLADDIVYLSDVPVDEWWELLEDAKNGAAWMIYTAETMPIWASRATFIAKDVKVQREDRGWIVAYTVDVELKNIGEVKG